MARTRIKPLITQFCSLMIHQCAVRPSAYVPISHTRFLSCTLLIKSFLSPSISLPALPFSIYLFLLFLLPLPAHFPSFSPLFLLLLILFLLQPSQCLHFMPSLPSNLLSISKSYISALAPLVFLLIFLSFGYHSYCHRPCHYHNFSTSLNIQ